MIAGKGKFLIAVLAIAAWPAHAQVAHWYAGLAAGQVRTSDDLVRNRESTITNASDIHTAFDNTDNAWKGFAGYRFNEFIAIEVGYADLGSHRMTTTLLSLDPPLPGAITIDRSVSGLGADLVGSWPLGPRFGLFGRVGAFDARIKADARLEGNVVFNNGDPNERSRNTSQRETVLHFGAGASWNLTPSTALRLEWERYNDVGKAFAPGATGTTGEASMDAVTLGVLLRF